ncbi:UDP-N-acetyl-D-glucosamine 6-dehydrogenase [Colletotrichum sp. SAR11_59]|uniref:Udp-glucose dehydrogenase udp-mannac n=1 Tax=Colletotrichum asianum TaxID=702518 RepID=A0A8H3WL31_9PEZI|nr:udp-glucose dehydrogenase udp-mannac [Colletotrichum asianum]KAI8297362.1 UDP-N-acetyl-D-glucosamine 6-dehydrogenase [Colletotrichum sp. SAR11_59]
MDSQLLTPDTPERSPTCRDAFPFNSPESSKDRAEPWEFSHDGYYPITPPWEECESDEELATIASSIDLEAEPLVAVIGVGYVGEHLVGNFARKFNVLGFDVSEARVQSLEREFGPDSKAKFTSKPSDMGAATHFLISVPTLLRPDQTVDTSFLRSALKNVATYARAGSVVVVESSVAVGMTRELLGPLAQERHFFAGMSPERVDPGRVEPPAHAIPKIVSGLDDMVPGSLNAIVRLYSQVFDNVVPVSRPEVAEMTKLYENCQRMMCIAFANEMADACVGHGVDPYEVSGAAATKPFGYMPFTPSLGVGGHCIPVNPYYLLSNNQFPLLQHATERMRARPSAIAQRAVDALCAEKPRPSILVVGMGFKKGQSHLANSPGLELAKSLVLSEKVDVCWADPLVKQEAVPQIPRLNDVEGWNVKSLEERFDMIIVAFRQSGLDFDVLSQLQSTRVEMWCN